MMKVVVVVTACLAFLVLVTEGTSHPSCRKFSQLAIKPNQNMTHWCPELQCPHRTSTSGKVVGTGVYFGGSDICLAALHAGVVAKLGTNVIVTELMERYSEVFGTSQNRIVSLTKHFPGSKRRSFTVENQYEETGVVGEVLMVHNGGAGSVAHFTCLSQDQKSAISADNLRSVDYKAVNLNIKSGNGSSKLVFEFAKDYKLPVVRLLGSQRREDVQAVLQYPDARPLQSKVATVRANKGDKIMFSILGSDEPSETFTFNRHLNTTKTYESYNSTSTSPRPPGVYSFQRSNNKKYKRRAYVELMIRSCEAGKFGPLCAHRCPQCLNGGQCHSRLGTCVCAPGFTGHTCQYACPPGWFGNNCQFKCSQDFRGSGAETEVEGSCRGLTVCQPPPYGCSCVAGFSHPEHRGPTCSRVCSDGSYGADCELQCQNCERNKCDPVSGTCILGCKENRDCRKGMSLNVTVTPSQRGFQATWSTSSDTYPKYFLSHKLLGRLSCPTMNDERHHELSNSLSATQYDATNLLSYAVYNVCVVASSSMGLSPPSCSKVETFPEVPSMNITHLFCNESENLLNCFVNVAGGCENYNGPNVIVTFTLQSTLTCTHPSTINQTSLSSIQAKVSFADYVHGVKYQVTAVVRNDHGAGTGHNRSIMYTTELREPDPPEAIKPLRGARQLNLTMHLPRCHGGTIINCTISLIDSQRKDTISVDTSLTAVNFTFDDLEPGRKDEAKGNCCNKKFCGNHLKVPVATNPTPIELAGALSILSRTDSTVTLHLPRIIHNGDGSKSFLVFVQLESQNHSFSNASVIELFEAHNQQTRKKRQSQLSDDQCGEPLWIAAKLNQDAEKFVVGDGSDHGGFFNCPLKLGQGYNIGLMGVIELLGKFSYSFMMTEGRVTTVARSYEPLLLLLLLLLLILPIFGLLAYLWHCRQPSSKGFSQSILASNELQPMKPSATTTEDKIDGEAIYENLKAPASPSSGHSVPYAEVEAYLNKVIGSKEAGEYFRTVPKVLTKSMAAAQLPDNKAKNRFKNNHPYDDTRVVLSQINGNPSSDYINANHVQGYGNMRYIAAQGPLDGKKCTIADFWRMVVEQHINAIIMVASFVENGKRKVGEYFIPEQTSKFDDFEVMVKSIEQLPHFTVSLLSVRWKEKEHHVQHYHYQKWPDHGIPFEANSIAQMIIHFQSHQSDGGAIVHCSAGIGRTGTVLQVLLMCEMLNLKGYLSPLEVLARLRMSRARLVENEAQYNLSLEILEEILFGNKTVISTDYLLSHLDDCVLASRSQYAKAKALPSPLTYTTTNLPVFLPLNRNKSILPPDSSRLYLQPKAEVEAGLSQYINAVRVPGSSKQEFILATEHPLPNTVVSFWRLVVERECPLLIFINSLENQKESEYPAMLHKAGEVWQAGDYQLQVEKIEPYGTWLSHFTLTITSNRNSMHRLDVYQSTQWPVSSSLPPSPFLLLTIAEMLQVPRSAKAAPTLLCCGDGVTGCGLVAGMALIVEHLQREQLLDIYRMVIKLQRARQQFIVSEEQFSMLYTGAAMYLREFSGYGNFQ